MPDDDFVDGRAAALGEPLVIERGRVCVLADDVLVHDAINLICGDAWPQVSRGLIQRLSSDATRVANGANFLLRVDMNLHTVLPARHAAHSIIRLRNVIGNRAARGDIGGPQRAGVVEVRGTKALTLTLGWRKRSGGRGEGERGERLE